MHSVKNALRLPALFLLFFILLAALLTGLSLLELRVEHSGEKQQAARLVASRFAPVLLERFPAAVLFALVLTLFPLYRRPGNRLLSYLLPMAAAFAVLAFGGQALRRALPKTQPPAPGAADYFLPERFQEFGESVLYVDAEKGSRLDGVVLRSQNGEGGHRLTYLGSAEVLLRGGKVVLRSAGGSRSVPARPAFSVLLAEADGPVGRLLAGFSADLTRVAEALDARFKASLSSYYLICLALVFSFFAAGLFFRVSRWPLANVLLAFLVMRGYLFLFRWLRDGVAREAARLAGAPRLAGYLPEAALLVLGAVLLLVDLLFLPYGRSPEELGDA